MLMWLLIAIFGALLMMASFFQQNRENFLKVLLCGVLLVCIGTYNGAKDTPEQIKQKELLKQEKQKQVELLKIPKLISEVNGCKTYKFVDDGLSHYFTNCGDTTTNNTTHRICSGKSCRDVVETTQTRNQ